MKNIIFSCLVFCLFSCGSNTVEDKTDTTVIETPKPEETTTSQPAETPSESEKKEINISDLLGSYVGMFTAEKYDYDKAPTWANKITVSLDKIEGESISGRSIVAGNDRPFSGTITPFKDDSGKFSVQVKEPGDDKYDGSFSFTLDPHEEILKGTWDANDDKLAVTKRKYKLEKKAFKYDRNLELEGLDYTELYGTYNEYTNESEGLTNGVSSKNASAVLLTKKDVENLHKGDLEVMRNAIYARHGYSFKNRKMRYVFNYVDWYIPYSTDIRNQLTDLEKKNIDLLKRYEQHAEKYYDVFGR